MNRHSNRSLSSERISGLSYNYALVHLIARGLGPPVMPVAQMYVYEYVLDYALLISVVVKFTNETNSISKTTEPLLSADRLLTEACDRVQRGFLIMVVQRLRATRTLYARARVDFRSANESVYDPVKFWT